MIPRLLVPEKLSPLSATPTDGRKRAWTILDDRLVVPAQLPVKPLQVESNIPLHVPLGVLGERILIPREAVPGKLELPAPGDHLLPTDADERMAVPVDARPAELVAESILPIEVLEQEDLVTPDVFTTGQVQFMPKQVSEPRRDWSWMIPAGSFVFHVVLVLALFSLAAIFPHHEPTAAELEAASRELGIVYLPNTIFHPPKAVPKPQMPSDELHVDPGLMRKLVPETIPAPAPGPVLPPQVVAPHPAPELPSAPVPQIPQQQRSSVQRAQTVPTIETPKPAPDAPNPAFKLPSMSPGRALDDAARGAMNHGGTSSATFGDVMPRGGAGGPIGGGGGAGDGYLGGAVQMLTPDQGVDFSGYLNRVVVRLRKNWLIPESAQMGDRGWVVYEFKIMRDGSVPPTDPLLRRGSGEEPLDYAARGAITGSNPFEPLPSAFSGPYIVLRVTFIYNLPPGAAQ
jgi:outer membrane biosynthesis protein TonB